MKTEVILSHQLCHFPVVARGTDHWNVTVAVAGVGTVAAWDHEHWKVLLK